MDPQGQGRHRMPFGIICKKTNRRNWRARRDSNYLPAMPPILGAVTLILILAAILIPGQIVSRVARDETSAMESLRALTDLELQ
jgi:hypothetical protein